VALARAQNVRVLGASNYYDFEVYTEFQAEARRLGVFPLFGLEIIGIIPELQGAGILINDPGNPGRIYLCGKGITRFEPMNRRAGELMLRIRDSDARRMREMTERLEQVFADGGIRTGLSDEAITDGIVRKYGVRRDQVCLQERHVAQAFQEALFALVEPDERNWALSRVLGVNSNAGPGDSVRVQSEIRTHLMKVGKPAFVAERFLDFGEAISLVLELGGIPSYPTLADGASPICAYEYPVDKLIKALGEKEIHCAEFIPIRNETPALEHYVRAMRGAGIVVTAGTEHNTLDLIPMEPTCLRGMKVPVSIRDVFAEGACVVAAHQYLTLHGECGFVDETGKLNPGYPDAESRISHFRRLGAALIAGYHEQSLN
jgi:hypothetical protein